MNPIGIMQGRLSPRPAGRAQAFPRATWQDEFTLAQACGFDRIEWLVTAEHVDDNPIWSDAGVAEIRARTRETGIGVTTLCADCFITRPFVRVDEAVRQAGRDMLEALIRRCAIAAIGVIVVPVLEAGAIHDEADARVLRDVLRQPAALAHASGVVLALESDLPVDRYLALFEGASPSLGAAYDVGNATACGYDVAADLQTLGPCVRAVHLKDRRHDGPNVPLGDGDTDFDAVFDGLAAAGYTGPLILETPVGDAPMLNARRHLAFVRDRRRVRAAGGVTR